MNSYQVNGESHRRRELVRHEKHLWGKAVLLIGNDTAVLQSLVSQLAEKGANIALLCWRLPREIGRKLKEHVQSLGQQLLLIEWADKQTSSLDQLMRQIVAEWGRLDIFIDVSTRQNNQNQSEDSKMLNAGPLPPKWQLTYTVLEEMVSS